MKRFGVVAGMIMGCNSLPSSDLELEPLLTERGGCGDALFFARTPENEAVLTVWAEGATTAAEASGGPWEREWSLPTSEVEVLLELGVGVGQGACNDVIEVPVRVEHRYLGTQGTLRMSIDGSTGELTLEDVMLRHEFEEGEPLSIPKMTIEAENLGFLPG